MEVEGEIKISNKEKQLADWRLRHSLKIACLCIMWVLVKQTSPEGPKTVFTQDPIKVLYIKAPTEFSKLWIFPQSFLYVIQQCLWFHRSQLSRKCHGFDSAFITQDNTPVGAKIVYDGEKTRTLQVTPEIFSTFPKVRRLAFMNIYIKTKNKRQ